MSLRLAGLLTVHNRKQKTLRCLQSFAAATTVCSTRAVVDLFLVDDGSTDGTAAAVSELFPAVNIIRGNGSLYWCGGMRAAWEAAVKSRHYDGYIWLNDDVVVKPNMLTVLLDTAEQIQATSGRPGIVVGSTQDAATGHTSYGEMGPDGIRSAGSVARSIESFNGNIVLVPHYVFKEIGFLSRAYRHGFGDLDYACRARNHGVPIWLAPGHLGMCSMDKTALWESRSEPLLRRLIALHRPTGCPPWELAVLTIRNGGWWFPYTVAKLYWRVLFPSNP